jgi:hypothetical protein
MVCSIDMQHMTEVFLPYGVFNRRYRAKRAHMNLAKGVLQEHSLIQKKEYPPSPLSCASKCSFNYKWSLLRGIEGKWFTSGTSLYCTTLDLLEKELTCN